LTTFIDNSEIPDIEPSNATTAFQSLEPHQILDAIDAVGWQTDGRVSALNSYENRVYSIGLESGESVVTKFYRPARWTDEAILEEHAFCDALVERDIPVITPLRGADGQSLHHSGPFRFSIYPRAGGRPPELDNPAQLAVIGRTIGRLHLVSDTFPFQHRPTIDAIRFGDDCADFLLDSDILPAEQAAIYESVIDDLLPEVHDCLDDFSYREISLHGDFHPGNILWGSDETPHLLDFDDAATGPAIQDLWMFISGPLRTLRIIHYAAWIAKRWKDPAFVKAFPFFAHARFWDEHIQSLREQRAALDEPWLVY